jgi:hypothetical protein
MSNQRSERPSRWVPRSHTIDGIVEHQEWLSRVNRDAGRGFGLRLKQLLEVKHERISMFIHYSDGLAFCKYSDVALLLVLLKVIDGNSDLRE